ncbi:MAG: hypothetical protein ABIL58_08570 [Pseudomonadota bacterium]
MNRKTSRDDADKGYPGYSKRISEETASSSDIKAFAKKPIGKADLAKTVRKVLDEAKGHYSTIMQAKHELRDSLIISDIKMPEMNDMEFL